MNLWMEGLHPSAENFGAAGVLGHLTRGESGRGERLKGSARAEKLKAKLKEPSRERDQSALVGDAKEGQQGQSCDGRGATS